MNRHASWGRWATVACLCASAIVRADVARADARVERILSELERRSDGLKDILCKVEFIEEDHINLTKRTKSGSVRLMMAKPNPLFLIHFKKSVTDDGLLGKQEWYLFDGRWLHQAVERLKQVTKREIARDGEELDFFNLAKTPFPLPFGQKKDEMLREFEVTLIAAADGDPPATDHLLCVPKPEGKFYGKYDQLEFFVRRDIHLPSRIVATKNGRLEVNTVTFSDLASKTPGELTGRSLNTGVTKKDFEPVPVWRSYKVVVETQDSRSSP